MHGDDVERTVAATTSDSTIENVGHVDDADDSNNDDARSVDVSPVYEMTSPAESATGGAETVKSLTPEPPLKSWEDVEMSSDVSVKVSEVEEDCEEDLQETRAQDDVGCHEVLGVPECVTDTDEELSGTQEPTAAEDKTGADVMEATDDTPHGVHQQQEQQRSNSLLELAL